MDGTAYAKKLGADETIDYRNEAFEKLLHDYDAVFDTVGGETYTKSFKVLKKGGVIVSMVEQPNTKLAEQYGVTALVQYTDANTARLTHLAELVDRGTIKVYVDKIFALEQAKQAFKYLEEGHPRGKVVLKIRD